MMEKPGSGLRIEVTRGDRVESVHDIDLAVVERGGDVVLRAGRPEETAFARSALKPFQALPLVEDGVADEYGLTAEELALCCASHSGEARHVELARSILDRLGLKESALACGPHPPFGSAAATALAEAGREPGRVHNNCSGKHAGMLALARGHGWALNGYEAAGHPVQERVAEEIERWTGVERSAMDTAVDGCGVVTFALPTTAIALAFARLAAAAGEEPDGPAGRVVTAMARNPFVVGGSNRLCTAVMEATGGRVLAKVGAEGVYGAAAIDRRWGIALKARDGARRAAEMALVAVLDELELLRPEERSALDRWLRPELKNTRGEVVGGLRARLEVTGGG